MCGKKIIPIATEAFPINRLPLARMCELHGRDARTITVTQETRATVEHFQPLASGEW